MCFSQGETNNWYFGYKSALNFQDYTPQELNNSRMFTKNGCSTISDDNGNLLFYSNGFSIYNKNGEFMEDAFPTAGYPLFSQNSIFIPHPENNDIIYLFTTTKQINNPFFSIEPGFYYTIISKKLNGGNGGVISSNKLLTSNSAEKISAVHHANGKDIWIITNYKSDDSKFYNKFFCIKLNSKGLSTPVISNTIHNNISDARGALKFSPNGKKLISANYSQGVHLYDFNNETGEVTNGEYLKTAVSDNNFIDDNKDKSHIKPYSVEFSNDSEFVYYTGNNQGVNYIFQKKIKKTFEPTKTIIINNKLGDFSSLQLAKNGKIYVTNFTENNQTNTLSEITSPEKLGSDCEFSSEKTTLNYNYVSIGLPNFIQSYFRTRIVTNDVCLNNKAEFSIDSYTDITPLFWDFGDGNQSNETTPSHKYNSPGKYLVKVEASIKDKIITLYKEIIVFPLPELKENQKLTQCDVNNDGVDYFNLFTISNKISNANSREFNYLFYETLKDAELDSNRIQKPESYTSKSNPQTIYIRVINSRNCYSISNFKIESNYFNSTKISSLTMCENSNDILNDGLALFNLKEKKEEIRLYLNLPESYLISFYQTLENAQTKKNKLNNSFISSSTKIWVRIDNSGECSGIESFDLIVNSPKINLKDNYIICINPSSHPPITLTAESSNDRFEWKDENNKILSNNNSYTLTKEGNFSLTVYKTVNGIECSNSKSFTVNYPPPAKVESVDVNVVNELENTLSINISGNSNYEYSLDNINFTGSGTSHSFANVQPGIATIYIKDLNKCEPSITTSASIIGFPKFLTPNNDGVNDLWKVYGVSSTFFKQIDIKIFNRFGKIIYFLNDTNAEIGWDGSLNGKLLPSNDYWFHAKLKDLNNNIIDKKGHFTLKRD